MLRFPYFLQECPICGRPAEVQTQFTGRVVKCRHCGGDFVAMDPTYGQDAAFQHGDWLLTRADQLLDMLNRRSTLQPRLVDG